jgi:Leucine-rich repeat (LRR) protein
MGKSIVGFAELSFFSNNYYCRNFIGSIPSEIGLLRELSSLTLSSNLLVGLPSEIGQLENLVSFDASVNQLNTTIPNELANGCLNLEVLCKLSLYILCVCLLFSQHIHIRSNA